MSLKSASGHLLQLAPPAKIPEHFLHPGAFAVDWVVPTSCRPTAATVASAIRAFMTSLSLGEAKARA